jgi:hypothetical protein
VKDLKNKNRAHNDQNIQDMKSDIDDIKWSDSDRMEAETSLLYQSEMEADCSETGTEMSGK